MLLSTLPPPWFLAVFSALFGLVVGSFLNVVVVRVPRRQSVVTPRSRCPGCGASIRWQDNIPLLSYALLRGRCRGCGNPIPLRYPIIEGLTGLLFLAVTLRFGWSPLFLVRDWPFVALLVAITFIDLEHRIIPDRLSLGGLVLGLVTSPLSEQGWLPSFTGAAFGFSVFYAIAWLYYRLSGKSGLGGGDIKLLAMLGAFLGPAGVFSTILISSILGSVVGIIWGLASKKTDVMKLSIPFGPFLVVGALYYYLLGDVLWLQFTIPT